MLFIMKFNSTVFGAVVRDNAPENQGCIVTYVKIQYTQGTYVHFWAILKLYFK